MFKKIGVDLSSIDDVISWLQLKSPMECIHIYWLYTKCFNTLICYDWAYGSTLILLHLCWLGWNLGDIGVDLSLGDVAMSWLRLKPPVECIPHPYDM